MGKFDFQRRLGSGYFGEVWLANDTSLNALCAVKLIQPDRLPDQNNFFHEAQVLKKAEHPNVVRIKEADILDDGRVYVSMEYLKKGSLEDEARGSYVDLTRAKRIMVDVLRGLQHAHSKGIIHRDIKPANVLIGNAYEGKLSDFGLALARGVSSHSSNIHHYNYIAHLAPEIFGSRKHNVLSDIYACGVTLYRLVNGDSYLPPLPTDQILRETRRGRFPDRSKYREFIPIALKRIINKAINLDSSKRYKSADEMRHALEQVDIHMNWRGKRLADRMQWIGCWDGRCYLLEQGKDKKGKAYVRVSKGASKKSLRNISKLNFEGGNKEIDRHVRKVLQDIVAGKIK